MTGFRGFKYIIVVANPKSTNAHTTARRVAELRAAAPAAEVVMVETSAKGRLANKKLLRRYVDKLGKHTLVCIAAGDGTVSTVIDGLLTDQKLPSVARQTPVLPLWGGNANDLAHMLNGRAYKTDLPALLRAAHIVKIYPICCTLTPESGPPERRLASSYASFGASAYTTKVLAKAIREPTLFHRWPMGRFVQEFGIVVGAMRRAPVFEVVENNQKKTVFEYIFFNGPRFAKIEGVKRRLGDKSFHRARIERKRLSAVAASLFQLTRRDSRALETTSVSFTTLQDTWAQFDGESADIPAGTTVEVTVADEPFYALATRF